MGIFDMFRRTGLVAMAAADDWRDATRPVTPPADNIAPVLAAALNAPPGWEPLFEGGCLTRTTAMRVPAVRRGVRVISDAIAEMPLTRRRGLERIDSGTFLQQPEVWRPCSATIRETVTDMIFYQYAWWMVTARDWTGFPAAVVRLDPAYVSVTTIPGTDEPEYVYATYKGKEVPVEDLIRFDGPDEGILKLGTVAVMTALKLELSAKTYADPEMPSGVLVNTGEYRLTTDERREMMAEWRAARRAGSTAYLDANLEYRNTVAMPDQLQLVQGREESAVQIARLMNLPAYYLSAKSGDSMTYTSVPSQRRDLVDISLAPYISAIEDRLSMNDRNGSPQGQLVRFDRGDLLRSDAREDAEVGEILIRSGQSTADEQRARRGLPPLTAAQRRELAPPPTPAVQEPANAA